MENYKKFDFTKKAPYLMEFVQFVAVNNGETTERKVISLQEIISYKSVGSTTLMTEERDRESNEKINILFIFFLK